MNRAKSFLILLLAFFIATPADAFVWKFWEHKQNSVQQLEEPKTHSKNEEDLPDLLIPQPETPKQEAKRIKAEEKALKHSNKKTKPSKFKKNKKLKKYRYSSIKAKNKAPKTFEEYLEISKEIKREDMKIPAPSVPKDDKIVNLPEAGFRIVKYNDPPGSKDLDLRLLMTRRQLVTQGILSPDNRRLIYSVVYSYPTTEQITSEMFIINIPEGTSMMSALKDFHTIEADRTPILKVGTDKLAQNEKKTLTLLDWSEDGLKVAAKEKIGSQTQGPWKTQLWTYDFENGKAYELTALREAIRYYWRTKENLDLNEYMWDIYPIGWDMYNKDRIISYAYVYGKNNSGAKFLGTWSVDYKNQRTELMSETATDFEVSINGYKLEFSHE